MVVAINIIIVASVATTLNNINNTVASSTTIKCQKTVVLLSRDLRVRIQACTRRSCVRTSLALGIANKHLLDYYSTNIPLIFH
jgi:hypothetical protein